MMNEIRSTKGITLIALVITIIILLILAAVTIALILGENGLITKAGKAKEETEKAMIAETEALEQLDKYIQDNFDTTITEDEIAKFENNGIDKSHDGAKYDAVTTDDGMWTIYKDIDTETRKVNVYVSSKYYYPSFEEYVFQKFYLNAILYSYALPVYSFTDLTDAFPFIAFDNQLLETISSMVNKEKVKRKLTEMGIGPTLSDILEAMGVNEYDVYTEVGKKLVKQLKANEQLSVSSGDKVEMNGTEWGNFLGDIGKYDNDYTYSGTCHGPELNYNNLWNSYNKLYGDKTRLTIPEAEKSKTYKIELPDGTVQEIKGDELYKAKVRYITTKNGDIKIKITDSISEAKTINYTGVTNIGSCMYEDEEYLYTYNCLPMIDDLSTMIAERMPIIKAILLEENLDNFDEDNFDWFVYSRYDSMIYRFNLGRLECYKF